MCKSGSVLQFEGAVSALESHLNQEIFGQEGVSNANSSFRFESQGVHPIGVIN